MAEDKRPGGKHWYWQESVTDGKHCRCRDCGAGFTSESGVNLHWGKVHKGREAAPASAGPAEAAPAPASAPASTAPAPRGSGICNAIVDGRVCGGALRLLNSANQTEAYWKGQGFRRVCGKCGDIT